MKYFCQIVRIFQISKLSKLKLSYLSCFLFTLEELDGIFRVTRTNMNHPGAEEHILFVFNVIAPTSQERYQVPDFRLHHPYICTYYGTTVVYAYSARGRLFNILSQNSKQKQNDPKK